jgi:hypothetical protein
MCRDRSLSIIRIMKLKNFYLILIVLSLFLFTNCKKSAGKTEDYSPLTEGSSWTYTSTGGVTNKLTATNKDTLALGHTYRILKSSNGTNVYLGKNGNEYYRLGYLSVIGMNDIEELYLKDNEAVNATWKLNQTFSYPGIPLPLAATFNYTIKAKGISRTVSGKNFGNVIQVRLDISIAGFNNLGGGDFYYALGVGMIENTISINVAPLPAIAETTLLTSYEIK